jgi:hypothetical protein
MQDLAPRIVILLKKYMRDPAAWVRSCTTLRELGIDQLDLPMIFLDVEDQLGVQIDQCDDIATVGDLVGRVASSLKALEAKARQPRAPRPRRKSNWMSTSA